MKASHRQKCQPEKTRRGIMHQDHQTRSETMISLCKPRWLEMKKEQLDSLRFRIWKVAKTPTALRGLFSHVDNFAY